MLVNSANGFAFFVFFSAGEQKKVEYIIKPAMPIALRTGGHLLVGVVKIYSKKAQYLFDDATDALAKIKVSFLCYWTFPTVLCHIGRTPTFYSSLIERLCVFERPSQSY